MLFADDRIMFCRATRDECDRMLKVLEDYEGDSGKKKLNKEKTSLYFSKNTSKEIKEYVKEKKGFHRLWGEGKERLSTESRTK